MAFLKYNDIIYASATPANSQASLEAKNNGKPYGKLINYVVNHISDNMMNKILLMLEYLV